MAGRSQVRYVDRLFTPETEKLWSTAAITAWSQEFRVAKECTIKLEEQTGTDTVETIEVAKVVNYILE